MRIYDTVTVANEDLGLIQVYANGANAKQAEIKLIVFCEYHFSRKSPGHIDPTGQIGVLNQQNLEKRFLLHEVGGRHL